MNTSKVEFRDKTLKDFQSTTTSGISAPDADKRNFNVNDVLGDWERDDKGNVLVAKDKSGTEVDKQGRPANIRGYLINPKGDVVEGVTGKRGIMFSVEDLDERGSYLHLSVLKSTILTLMTSRATLILILTRKQVSRSQGFSRPSRDSSWTRKVAASTSTAG